MKTDRVFVLLLVVLLPLSGCFDGSTTGDAEGAAGADDSSNTTIVNNYYNNTTSSDSQEKTWYSSGGTYPSAWDDNGVVNGGPGCLEWGPTYDESTGDYLGESCKETGYRTLASQWNVSECTDANGVVEWTATNNAYRYAPGCTIEFVEINTTAGEALLLYELRGGLIYSTCDGSTTYTSYNSNGEYTIISGSAMDCNHRFYKLITYASTDILSIWSVVYAIQDVNVV